MISNVQQVDMRFAEHPGRSLLDAQPNGVYRFFTGFALPRKGPAGEPEKVAAIGIEKIFLLRRRWPFARKLRYRPTASTV